MPGKQLRNQVGLPQPDWDEWISKKSLRASPNRVKRKGGWYIQTAKWTLLRFRDRFWAFKPGTQANEKRTLVDTCYQTVEEFLDLWV